VSIFDIEFPLGIPGIGKTEIVEQEDFICTCSIPNPNFMGSGILLCTSCGDPIEGGPDEPDIMWLVPLDFDLVYERY
jgi:hypothetical protein